LLGVPHPDPKTGDPDRDRYVFERDVVLVHAGEKHTIGFIDLYKHGFFVLEAKQGSEVDSKKIGTARRATPAWNVAMQDAFGQALTYVTTIEPPPPFLIVTDIGYCFDLYASFDGTRNYRKFPDALNSRISVQTLSADDVETLRTIFTDPLSLDPSKRAAMVTREIAAHVAKLAVALEQAGHDPEKVAKFLMRCLFTMFAEDVGLLPKGIFADALDKQWFEHPEAFVGGVEDLWAKMNEGGYVFGIAEKIWEFDGGLFADPTALPLTKDQLWILGYAAKQNWAEVEPAIFGTLLERALHPKERHRLGAHFTPRAYVERLVRPTIEEPLRAEWDNVRAQVQALVAAEDPDKNIKAVAQARKIVNEFYDRLTRIRVLDPACGSGNFLYVALDLFKRLENEIIDQLDNLGEDRTRVIFTRTLSGRMVTPEQFHGIEIKPWAKEITELVLWIGWLQWQTRTREWKTHPREPILRDYKNIECRDAVLAYDEKIPLLDGNGEPVTQWNAERMKPHPVTGEPVPDEIARIPVYEYVKPRKTVWPEADFIVGNPPFIGNKRMREELGDGYVDALRNVYADVPGSVDYVMYWWNHAAKLLRDGPIRRFGLITTNSITQAFNRQVVQEQLRNNPPISLTFAIPDHPWVDSSTGSAVRVAMTSAAKGSSDGVLVEVISERETGNDAIEIVTRERRGRIHENLSVGADVTLAVKLRANSRICWQGCKLVGAGFQISPSLREDLVRQRPTSQQVVRAYWSGSDLTKEREPRYVIDLFGLDLESARSTYPEALQYLTTHVQPERAQNRDRVFREKWWLFGRPRPDLRAALSGLSRYIVTSEVAKHRSFTFLSWPDDLIDGSVIAVAADESFTLGILSSRAHLVWLLAAGGTLERSSAISHRDLL
jgi:hypothetical protein